jgi:hypothetical protein
MYEPNAGATQRADVPQGQAQRPKGRNIQPQITRRSLSVSFPIAGLAGQEVRPALI